MQVSIHEAKTHFSRLVQKAIDGEDVIVARGKEPVVKIVALPSTRCERTLGGGKDIVVRIADDFDAPLEVFEDFMK